MKIRKQLFQKGIAVLLVCITVVSACLVTAYALPDAEPEIGADYQYPKAEVMQIDLIMQPYVFLEMAHLSIKSKRDLPDDLDELKNKNEAFVSVNGSAFQKVAVRLRGASSLDENLIKPIKRLPFEICFDSVDPNGAWNGNPSLKLITCDSPGALFTELIAMESFRFMGIPTPSMLPAFVRINDVDFGMYLAVEDVNASFIARYYDGTGSLYAGKKTGDETRLLQPSVFDGLKIKTDHGHDTLERMDKAAMQGKSVGAFINQDEFLRYLACEAFTFDRDGIYAMRNFFLYDNHGQFEFLPWDKDLTFMLFSHDTRGIANYESIIRDHSLAAQLYEPEKAANTTAFYHYIQVLNDTFLDPSSFLPWLKVFIHTVSPFLERDAAFSRQSDHIYEDLTTGTYLYNGTEGNLLLFFETMHKQLQMQLQDETATYFIPPGCKVKENTASTDLSPQAFRYARREARRICVGYWKLRRQFYWQAYGTATVCVGSAFAVLLCIAVLSTRVGKVGFRRRKQREDVWNE